MNEVKLSEYVDEIYLVVFGDVALDDGAVLFVEQLDLLGLVTLLLVRAVVYLLNIDGARRKESEAIIPVGSALV